MTLDELRAWHAERAGYTRSHTGWHRKDMGYVNAPFPATRDGAASSLPPEWTWQRDRDEDTVWWSAFPKDWDGEEYPTVRDTGNEIYDRYALAKLAWEAEGAKA